MVMDIGQVCIGKTSNAIFQEGVNCVGVAVQQYVLWGVGFFLMGLLVASFIPTGMGKKLGIGLILLGIIMMVAFPYIILLWVTSLGFQIAVYSFLVFIVIMMILFPKAKDVVVSK